MRWRDEGWGQCNDKRVAQGRLGSDGRECVDPECGDHHPTLGIVYN